MKKFTISDDLMRRIKNAAANGSEVANALISAIKQHKDKSEETDKTIDYFDSVRIITSLEGRKAVRIAISCCRKDLTNKALLDYGNPQAPWFKENRAKISPKDFALVFKSMREQTFNDVAWERFDCAMRIPDKVVFKISSKMRDFERAYNVENYTSITADSQSTLHSSCMRYDYTARNAADFYANFAHARILMGELATSGEIVARAIVWDNVKIGGETLSFVDRCYSAFDKALLPAMWEFAATNGILLRKTHNDYIHKVYFTVLRDCTIGAKNDAITCHTTLSVPQVKWHKEGAPYLDTMSYLLYDGSSKSFVLSNTSDGDAPCVATFDSTRGYGSQQLGICPICGKVHGGNDLCDECRDENYIRDIFGNSVLAEHTMFKDIAVPAACIKRGKPTPEFMAYLALKKITRG